ncbi:glycosyltransferase family 9 protein [Phragmitibacter flavus]|uniref:Glycosyltransferase family 9 protein n=1 Tax=Phragmitibacter flavus TaxID=2576071 RepID=A0A5R8KF62_9BACT|nr:glycosyltransferase family 9 protein [Phragmitibacter flavus]TLD70897.1 glycosyltransferase family 9 protein [Phragmitibacter flavus]
MKPASQIFIVRNGALGDLVQMTPLLQQIRADLPASKITLFSSPNATSLFEGAPFIDDLVTLPAAWSSLDSGSRRMWLVWWKVSRHGKPDMLLSLESGLKRNLGMLLCRAGRKGGLLMEGPKPWHPFTHPLVVKRDQRQVQEHTSQQYLQLWEKVSGFADRGLGYNMEHLVRPQSSGSDSEPPRRHICLAPGAGNAWLEMRTKRWPAASYVELGSRLLNLGWNVIYLGGEHDLDGFDVPDGARNLLGKTSISEAARWLHGAGAMMGNDSGLLHLAISVGCPVVAAFGPTSEVFTGPFRARSSTVLRSPMSCAPCYRLECLPPPEVLSLGHDKPCCLHAISPDRALNALIQAAEAPSNSSSLARSLPSDPQTGA